MKKYIVGFQFRRCCYTWIFVQLILDDYNSCLTSTYASRSYFPYLNYFLLLSFVLLKYVVFLIAISQSESNRPKVK